MASNMPSQDFGRCYISELYLSAPHILTDILYNCTPTTFDAVRYTCKAIYSMSLDIGLLNYHLDRIINRQSELISVNFHHPGDTKFYSKLDAIKNTQGNLWRTRGMLLLEYLRMQSSWRLGECRKTVFEFNVYEDEEQDLELGDAPFDGALEISLGTMTGSAFSVMWSDKKKTNLKTYYLGRSSKLPIRQIEGLKDVSIGSHHFADGKYQHSIFATRAINRKIAKLQFKMDDTSVFAINEGYYKARPETLQPSNYDRWGNFRYWGYHHRTEQTVALLRVTIQARNPAIRDDEFAPLDMAYEMDWEGKRNWKVPGASMDNLTNVMLPDYADEPIRLRLGRDGLCTGKGYTVGIDDDNETRSWKVQPARRLEQDISRNGVWRFFNVHFSNKKNEPSSLYLQGRIAKRLVYPEPGKRFLITNPKTMTAKDWISVRINLELPPTTRGSKNGKLILATPTPASYFRPLRMRDPDIPWADPGFKGDDWTDNSAQENLEAFGALGIDPELIKTGCMLHDDVVNAELVTRVVGWTDDGVVWVWDINEKDVLDCGALVPRDNESESAVGTMGITGRKLGYVKDVRGIAATGDRLVQRIFLFTYGKELEVHRGGSTRAAEEENDSGISSLRKDDLRRGLARAMEMRSQSQTDPSSETLSASVEEVEQVEEEKFEEDEEENKWRMVTYSFGDGMGNPGGFRMKGSGELEYLW